MSDVTTRCPGCNNYVMGSGPGGWCSECKPSKAPVPPQRPIPDHTAAILQRVNVLDEYLKAGCSMDRKDALWLCQQLCITLADTRRVDSLHDALTDALSALNYIQLRYGLLDGVGWDRVQSKVDAAMLATPEKS